MNLKLTFSGDDPIPARVIAEVLKKIDQRLFVREGKRILNLSKEFPELKKEMLQDCYAQFKQGYKRKEFSMLQIASVERGCLEILANVNPYAVELVGLLVVGIFKKALEQTPMHKAGEKVLLLKIDQYFFNNLAGMIKAAVLDVGGKYLKDAAKGSQIPDRNELVVFDSIKEEEGSKENPTIIVSIKVLRIKPTFTYEQLGLKMSERIKESQRASQLEETEEMYEETEEEQNLYLGDSPPDG